MSAAVDRAELKIGGALFGGWKSIRIERGMEQISGTFSLSITERWAGQAERRPIRPGQACQVLIDGEPVITGYVDEVEVSYSKDHHSVTINGRDKTGDLVDCSAIHKSGSWVAGTALAKIAEDLCKPFGIKVVDDAEAGKLAQKISTEHRTAFECLETAARMKAVLLMSDGLGNLVITRASKTRIATVLAEGENVISGSAKFSWKDRHSKYTILSQSAPEGNVYNEKNNTSPSASSLDEVINRYRPLVVMAEDQGAGVTLKQRAEWERNVRIGRGNRGTITVQGWHHDGGLWVPNTLVPIYSPYLDVDADLLITSVAYTLDEGGTRCELQVCRAEAFELLAGVKNTPIKRKTRGKNGAESKGKKDWSTL